MAGVTGLIERDLATDRAVEGDFEHLRLHNVRHLSFIDVPAECYLHFGSREDVAVDLRELEGETISVDSSEKGGIGDVFLENPTGVTGTLTMFSSTRLVVAGGGGASGVNIDEFGGAAQSGVDVATKISQLGSSATDSTTSDDTFVSINAPGGRSTVSIGWDVSGAATFTIEGSIDGSTWFDVTDLFSDPNDPAGGPADPTGAEEDARTAQIGFDHVRFKASANVTKLVIAAKGA